jgi:hypothetical protein
MRQPFEETAFFSVDAVAQRWSLSTDKTARLLEKYRGADGFHDFGRPDRDIKRHVRKYSIIRVSPELLAKIEAEL